MVLRILLVLAYGVSACEEGGCEEVGLVQLKQADSSDWGRPVPYGVNLGGWLCLEDWFFSGHEGRFVSSSDESGSGVCLPPLLQGGDEPWPSEGVLVQRLATKYSPTYAAQVFESHRNSFITEGDLLVMAELGVKAVRVPVTWALFADALEELDEVYGKHDPRNESAVVPDPFYPEKISMVTIPRNLLETLFKMGHKHGLKFLLDLHAFPGGSSRGTYNGIYPLAPVFWQQKSRLGNLSGPEIGHLIYGKALEWLEGLEGDAKAAVEGISPMNEPGHLAGIVQPSFAPLKDILDWMAESIEMFRSSELAKTAKLYVNLIETAFPENDPFWTVAPYWWSNVTSHEERESWAIIDLHWYTAWGTKAGMLQKGVNITCNHPVEEIVKNLNVNLEKFTEHFAESFSGLKASSEFSASTNADALLACQDVTLTKAWMESQVHSMKSKSIQPFFWSFKMPYGTVYESGWSFRKLYGKNELPPYSCATGAGVLGATAAVPCFAADC